MPHRNTVFAQVLGYVPRHEFEKSAKTHHQGQRLRRTSRWDQFVAMSLGHLGKRQSLRDILWNTQAQAAKLYHLGSQGIARSTLARLNEQQPFALYEALFAKLYERCRSVCPGHGFRFKNPLYSLDTTFINLSFRIFPWAKYHRVKAAVKLHVGLDHGGGIPAFAHITDARQHDVVWGKQAPLPAHSIVVCDKGYLSYAWYKSLTDRGVFFVTRLRRKTQYKVLERRPVDTTQGLLSDETITMTTYHIRQTGIGKLRLVSYRDPETKKQFEFLTNHFDLSAQTIAQIYRERWKIETFFKWLKQNLQIKSFLGTTPNAVMTQIWIALCLNLVLHYLKYLSGLGITLQHLLRLLQLNLFIRRDLQTLFLEKPPEIIPKISGLQGRLF